jgi:hypothetical protein
MEERKKLGPLGYMGLAVLLLVLALVCYLSAGLSDLSLGLGPWGIYGTDEQAVYLVTAYEQTDTGDLLITDRRKQPSDGALVTYRMNGRRTVDFYDDLLGRPVLAGEEETDMTRAEAVVLILREGGIFLNFLYSWRYVVWGITAVLVMLLIVSKATADARWRKRQQKLMRQNFQKYGEKYTQEDEELDY